MGWRRELWAGGVLARRLDAYLNPVIELTQRPRPAAKGLLGNVQPRLRVPHAREGGGIWRACLRGPTREVEVAQPALRRDDKPVLRGDRHTRDRRAKTRGDAGPSEGSASCTQQ